MAVSNGQLANKDTFNTAFMSRTQDTSTVGNVNLANTTATEGTAVTSAQRELNALNSFLGKAINTAKDALPTWASDIVGSASQTVKARIESIVAKFAGAKGHTHNGTDGDGAKIPGSNLSSTGQPSGYAPIAQGDGTTAWGSTGKLVIATGNARGTPTSVTAAGGITPAGENRQLLYVQGDGGAVDITANPQIAAGTSNGQELILVGRSDTNTVLLEDGTGLSLNGPCLLGENSVITLFWDTTVWVEVSRR